MSDIGNGRSRHADVIIVGGGSAGGVLARLLSEDPTRSVLLVEAGAANGVDSYPDDLRDPAHVPANSEHEWGYTARGGAAAPVIEVPRAKTLGGCSAHNAAVAMRARPSDIRDWQRHGLEEWTIEDVNETFREMENTPDGDDAYHGRTGPFPIRHERYDDLTPWSRGFIDATVAEGFHRVEALAQFIGLEIMPGDGVGDDQLADVIASNVASYGHPVATVPMGGPEDPWAVVDSQSAVKGIDGLRVADASIIPVAPSVAINATTIMIAERIAKVVYAGEHGPSHRGVRVAPTA
jgi:choline dehydrogenase-like flavoprotein